MSAHFSEQDESYFVSMTDLMVGMLFVFIILLMAFALNLKEQETKLTQTALARKELLEELKRTLESVGLKDIKIDIESGILRLPEAILFESKESSIKDQSSIEKLSSALLKTLPCYVGKVRRASCSHLAHGRVESVLIEGHTDNVPFGKDNYGNWLLSANRAISVYRALIEGNPGLQQLKNDAPKQLGEGSPILSISAYADQRPAESNATSAGQGANRRIDLRIIMAIPDPARQLQIDDLLTTQQQSP